MKINKLLIGFIVFSSWFIGAPKTFAQGCTNQYGSTVECPQNHIVINKKVRHPIDMNLFVENLTSNDTAYSPNDTVEYDIAVSNTSNVNYSTVTVTDTLPSYLTFESGLGTFDSATNTLTYILNNLNAGTTVHNRFTSKVKSKTSFVNDLTCNVDNYVKVVGPEGPLRPDGTREASQTDDDTASLCVQTKVLGVTTLPVAGFEDYAFMMPFALLAMLGSGLFMTIRKARP